MLPVSEEQEIQYYEPAEEEIRVGYECEILPKLYISAQTWKDIKCKNEHDVFKVVEMLKQRRVRTRKLDETQIQKEGWELKREYDNEHFVFTFMDHVQLDFKKNTGKIIVGNAMYTGECKSINQFRTLMKWLKLS